MSSAWFDTLFPDVSYPSSRLSGVLNRLVKKTEDLQKEGADLNAFLQEKIDFVSASVANQGLKRRQVVKEAAWTPEPMNELLSREAVDIENFRTKEKVPEKCTFQWIRTLSQSRSADSDAFLKVIEKADGM